MTDKTTHDSLLGATSRWTAGVRARESRREDRLYNDPWAAALAGPEGEEWVEHRSGDNGASITIRTRFFDDFLQRVTNEHQIRQVVLMAAGLDTRAYRLHWPEQTQLFELDQPEVLRYKKQVLSAAGAQAACERHVVEVDLPGSWTDHLVKAGFDVQQPSAWLLEGFLHYLPNENITRIFNDISGLAAPGSWLGFDTINSAMLTSQWTRQFVQALADAGVPWFGTIDEPEEFLRPMGWEATIVQPGEKEANYGRWPYPVLSRDMADIPRSWFVTAQKNSSMLL